MTSKIKIKSGSIDIEFEGSEEYMKEELPALVELVYSLTPSAEDEEESQEDSVELPTVASSNPTVKKLELTTNTIAARLDVKKGPELVIAACAHLTFVKSADKFTRQNILAEMKLATNYYTDKNHRKNLSGYLKTLVKNGTLLETSTDTYALQASTTKTLETQLNGN